MPPGRLEVKYRCLAVCRGVVVTAVFPVEGVKTVLVGELFTVEMEKLYHQHFYRNYSSPPSPMAIQYTPLILFTIMA